MQAMKNVLNTIVKPVQPIDFIDLKAQQLVIRDKLDTAIKKVLDEGNYILGPEVTKLEEQLSNFCGAKHSITCSNGTDALALALRALGAKRGDAIFVPSFTFAATAEVVTWFGATPIFVDILEDTYNMDATSLKDAIVLAKSLKLNPTGVIPVDLFGLPADYASIKEVAEQEGLWVIADAAQSFGAIYKGQKVGTIATVTTTSFFPAKPLGCYGDGGAIFTEDNDLAEIIYSTRLHGKGLDKYDNVRIGMNARLDTLQAAILIEKLAIFPDEIELRNKVAHTYTENLKDIVITPFVCDEYASAWAQYTIRLPDHVDREKLIDFLKQAGIPTSIYYIKPLHQQIAYKSYPGVNESHLPVTEKMAKKVLSLPMHPYLKKEAQEYIIYNLERFLNKNY